MVIRCRRSGRVKLIGRGGRPALFGAALLAGVAGLGPGADAKTCSDLTFACLRPEFLKTEIPAYWQHQSPTSPATYDRAAGDYLSQFTSPSGKLVTVVVKSPVTTAEYDAPPIRPGESTDKYLNDAFFSATGQLRTGTLIRFPKGAYVLPGHCQNGFNWALPDNLTDVVIDGQGSSLVFSGLCNGVGLSGAARVVLRNFNISWPDLKIASVGAVTAVDTAASTYTVHVGPLTSGPAPRRVASAFAWDREGNHDDLIRSRENAFYGDGVTSGARLCSDTSSGCDVTLDSQGSPFVVGQSVVLHYYNYGSAIAVVGQDITFDHLNLENLIGAGFALFGGRGLRVSHCTITRTDGEPLGAGGNASAEFGSVSGDVVFDNNFFGYSGDDGFQLNWNIVQYSPVHVVKLSQYQVMPALVFSPLAPDKFKWPYQAAKGDVFVLYDNNLRFEGVRTVEKVGGSSAPYMLTLDRAIDKTLIDHGFVGGDLTQFAGARYVVSNNTFAYTAGRALLLQTPFGLVDHNRFVGQTARQIYVNTSLFWGEGGSAQELTISDNVFDATGHGGSGPTLQGGDFLPIDIAAEPADPYLNFGPEVVGGARAIAPSVNQNIIVANNVFTSDRVTAVVNLSSMNNVAFVGNHFALQGAGSAAASDQYPISIHDASNVYFDKTNTFSAAWLGQAFCRNSRLLDFPTPPAVVSLQPIACGVAATTTNIDLNAAH
jgi:hypothetical protein